MSKPPQDTSIAARQAALKTLLAVLKQGQSLSSLDSLTQQLEARDAAFARLLSYGVLRFYHQLRAQLLELMPKPLKAKDADIELILLLAIYQVLHTRVPDYAVVDMAVKQVRKTRKNWASKLVNGVLRNYLRQQEAFTTSEMGDEARFSHPQWIIDRLRADWPQHWQAILEANNQQPPMTLRVNRQKIEREKYQATLQAEVGIASTAVEGLPSALIMEQPAEVTRMPGYAEGWFSVQDAGAQFAAQLLQPAPGDRVLDACAAPGGKTAHLFEIEPQIELTAVDISEQRLGRVEENCQRLGFRAELVCADAAHPETWWQGEGFDRILLDVPCSATGVIRRHPDIKHLRRAEDIEALVQLQRQILLRSWDLLNPGGRLLYATCSVFRDENERQVEDFLQSKEDAVLVELPDWIEQYPAETNLQKQATGIQLFPLNGINDGFYYALLEKKSATN